MYRRPLCVLLLFAASGLLAQDKKDPPKDAPKSDDPIAVQLAKDKEVYAAATEKARDNMLLSFDKHYAAVKNNKQLKIDVQVAQLEKIEAEKKSFQESSIPPNMPALKDQLAAYRAAQKKADGVLKAAFDKGAKAYRDKGDVKAASETLEEAKELIAKSGAGMPAYTVTVALSSKVLGVAGGGDGTRVVTADYAKGDQSQLWRSVRAEDGYFYIQNVKSGLMMTASTTGFPPEVVVSPKKTTGEGQLWKSVPVDIPEAKGAVRIQQKGGTKVLGVDGRVVRNGARVLLGADDNEASQWFGLLPPK